MKKITLILVLFTAVGGLSINTNAQTPVPGGNVSGTWALTGSPYLIQGAIIIPNDSTLTIEPGVTVNFQGTYKLYVQGRIIAIGTATDTIIFTVANTTNGWRGIRFDNTPATNDTSKLYYCKLQYGKATGNSPDNKGGTFYFYNFSKVIIANCRISNCTANSYGGGIFCYSSSPTISNNTISNNTTNNGGGGGIYCDSGSPTISNNTISNNTAYGGGGGIYCFYSSPTISNNTISNNTTNSNGGGIFCYSNNSTITNNTIVNNSAVNGGALYCTGTSNPILRNTILWGNIASTSGQQVFLNDEGSDPNFYYCNVQGGTAAFGLNGNFYTGIYQNNINADPLFVAPSAGSGTSYDGVNADWSLQSGSPCINAGDPSGTYPATDIAGNPRIIGGTIDIGAYEYQTIDAVAQYSSQTAFAVYPNPSSGKIQVISNQYSVIGIEIYNVMGEKIYSASHFPLGKEGDGLLDLSLQPAGIYLLQIKSGDKVDEQKIIKQ